MITAVSVAAEVMRFTNARTAVKRFIQSFLTNPPHLPDNLEISDMSTRSAILMKTETGYAGIYCHFDGYEEGAGATLYKHYQDSAKIAKLIALGDVSCLDAEVETNMPHSYERPHKGVTVAYMRDRGETNCEPKSGKTIKEVEDQIGHNGYVYVWNGKVWNCNGSVLTAKRCGIKVSA